MKKLQLQHYNKSDDKECWNENGLSGAYGQKEFKIILDKIVNGMYQ